MSKNTNKQNVEATVEEEKVAPVEETTVEETPAVEETKELSWFARNKKKVLAIAGTVAVAAIAAVATVVLKTDKDSEPEEHYIEFEPIYEIDPPTEPNVEAPTEPAEATVEE